MFLMLYDNVKVRLWSCGGDMVTYFEDHIRCSRRQFVNETYITSDKFIISYCKPDNCRDNCVEGETIVFLCYYDTLLIKSCLI